MKGSMSKAQFEVIARIINGMYQAGVFGQSQLDDKAKLDWAIEIAANELRLTNDLFNRDKFASFAEFGNYRGGK